MQVNHDKTRRTLVHGASLPWIASPASGVQRRMLYREGHEDAIATSLVRYEAGCRFPAHRHHAGEEFLVLDGTFQDERGDYPAGTYVRNPPGSHHAPASETGCLIFVRLQQFAENDTRECVIDTRPREGLAYHNGPCVTRILFSDHGEHVTLHDSPCAAVLHLSNEAGLELLMLSGSVEESEDLLQPLSWLRLPPGVALLATVLSERARIWVKRTHSPRSGAARP